MSDEPENTPNEKKPENPGEDKEPTGEVKPRALKEDKKVQAKDVEDNVDAETSELESQEKKSDEEIDQALAQSRLFELKKTKRKTQMKWAGGGFGLFLFGLFIAWGLHVPMQEGSFRFGICRVFVELYVQYPDTIKLGVAKETSRSVELWFEHIDSFGENHLQLMECYFKKDESGKVWQISRAEIDRREIDPDVIADFNRSIPMIYAFPPELEYRYELPRGLAGLKFNTDLFRRRLF